MVGPLDSFRYSPKFALQKIFFVSVSMQSAQWCCRIVIICNENQKHLPPTQLSIAFHFGPPFPVARPLTSTDGRSLWVPAKHSEKYLQNSSEVCVNRTRAMFLMGCGKVGDQQVNYKTHKQKHTHTQTFTQTHVEATGDKWFLACGDPYRKLCNRLVHVYEWIM